MRDLSAMLGYPEVRNTYLSSVNHALSDRVAADEGAAVIFTLIVRAFKKKSSVVPITEP
jgi:hypothetical protein